MTTRAIDNVVRDMNRTEEQARDMIARAVPRGTLIRPDEVAGTVAWLCSPEATGISGQAITIAAGEI
jgi:NAD(P)-dependent dehydrogenase (short-subunit alcohol dehydrogenase family)